MLDEQRARGDAPTPRAFRWRVLGAHQLVQRLGVACELEAHTGCVNTVHFNAAGDLLVSGSDDRQIKLWDWRKRRVTLSYASGHTNNVFQAKTLPNTNDRTIVSCAADGHVRYGVLSESGATATKLLRRHDNRAHKLSIEPGSPFCFLTCGEDGKVYHIDLRERRPGSTLINPTGAQLREYQLYSIQHHPLNVHMFAVGGTSAAARVYDQRHMAFEHDPDSILLPLTVTKYGSTKVPRTTHMTSVAWSHDGTELLTSYNRHGIFLYDTTLPGELDHGRFNPACEQRHFVGHRNIQTVKSVIFYGPNSEYVMTGSDCGNLFVFDKKTGDIEMVRRADTHVVNCLEPHPFAGVLATSGIDDSIKLWEPLERARVTAQQIKKIVEHNRKAMSRHSFDEDEDESGQATLAALLELAQRDGAPLNLLRFLRAITPTVPALLPDEAPPPADDEQGDEAPTAGEDVDDNDDWTMLPDDDSDDDDDDQGDNAHQEDDG